MSKNDHREKSLISIADFAKKKNCSRQAVYHHINKTGNIIPVYIGINKYPFIDWNQYKDFKFDDNAKRR